MSNLKEKKSNHGTKIMLVVENQKYQTNQNQMKNDLSNNFEHDNALTTPIQYLPLYYFQNDRFLKSPKFRYTCMREHEI